MTARSRTAILGAGPAGLVAAKLARGRNHAVTVFERWSQIGGIWNPASNGAYESVRTQTSRMAFHYSDHPPSDSLGSTFLDRQQFYEYLRSYIERFDLDGCIRLGHQVINVERSNDEWLVAARCDGHTTVDFFDRVIVATGELWEPYLPAGASRPTAQTAKEYRNPESLRGARVLVVGGGVSGADIAAELSGVAKEVDWSLRRRHLLLPRMWGDVPNDACFSYLGRWLVNSWERDRFLRFLEQRIPSYMQTYERAGLLPSRFINNAVHVNDTAIPAVASGRVRVKSSLESFESSGRVARFADGTEQTYDRVVLCAGYRPPDYSFIKGFSGGKVYRDFFYAEEPTLAILNTPTYADGFGTACPFFEAIAYWILEVFDGRYRLPLKEEMFAWCREQRSREERKVFYDCWLETIRIGLESGQLPGPAQDFASYWKIISNSVTPLNLRRDPATTMPAAFDDLTDIEGARLRILASLSEGALRGLVDRQHISPEDASHASRLRHVALSPQLIALD
jgi:dimethylaniline monooxygenase (N-oxide forming)